jgi:hypothetical protein
MNKFQAMEQAASADEIDDSPETMNLKPLPGTTASTAAGEQRQ